MTIPEFLPTKKVNTPQQWSSNCVPQKTGVPWTTPERAPHQRENMFFPFPPLSDSALLICCHSTSPIRFDTFQLKPHGRRCLGTPCVFPDALPSPDREQTKHIVDVTPRTKFRTSFPGINE
ncbi:hypothetical protein TNCV_2062802 [Trichonephila clavipes]|nr:hypothetical protein TNCV_2062802 [Trichonephila clavipes]